MSTALVPLALEGRTERPPRAVERPRAEFVAQLIAAKMQAPQTRTRRRAEPDEAIAAYRAGGRTAPPANRALSRSL